MTLKLIPPYGARLKTYRQAKGLTQTQLEDHAFLTQGAVSRIETSKINPSKETLLKLAKALDLNREEMVKLFCLDD